MQGEVGFGCMVLSLFRDRLATGMSPAEPVQGCTLFGMSRNKDRIMVAGIL